MAVTFAVGAVTGTVLSFEFGLLWPTFMGRWGEAFGVPFGFEGIFFFTEAIFVAIYIFGWRRMRPWAHFWTGVVVGVLCGLGALVLLARDAARGARALAVLAVAGIVVAWGVAQWPYLLPESLTVSDAAAPTGTLQALVVIVLLAAVVVGPAFVLLFVLSQRGLLPEEGD